MFDNLRIQIESKNVDEDDENDNYHSDNNCHNKHGIKEAEPGLECHKKESIGARSALKNI